MTNQTHWKLQIILNAILLTCFMALRHDNYKLERRLDELQMAHEKHVDALNNKLGPIDKWFQHAVDEATRHPLKIENLR